MIDITIQEPDVSVKGQVMFKVTVPNNLGKRIDGTDLLTKDVKYYLYYAQVGYSSSCYTHDSDLMVSRGSITISTSSDASDVMRQLGYVMAPSREPQLLILL